MVYYSRQLPKQKKNIDKAFSFHSGLISLHSGLMFWHLSHAPHRFLHVGVLFLRPLLAQHPSSEILERHPFLHQSSWSLGAGATDLFLLQFFESSWCSVWHWSSSLIMYDRRFERLKRFDLDLRWGSWSVLFLWLKPSPRSPCLSRGGFFESSWIKLNWIDWVFAAYRLDGIWGRSGLTKRRRRSSSPWPHQAASKLVGLHYIYACALYSTRNHGCNFQFEGLVLLWLLVLLPGWFATKLRWMASTLEATHRAIGPRIRSPKRVSD